ncbi:hypothetical protein BDQ17DRAFT_144622 [Cyathus striatus]|nr:hypothetical protein BDQ17DRAFT_144622 [Cyathus striatus]
MMHTQWVPSQTWQQNARAQAQQARENVWNRYKRSRPTPQEYLKDKNFCCQACISKEEVQSSLWVWANVVLPNTAALQPPENSIGRPCRASDSIQNYRQHRVDSNDSQRNYKESASRHIFSPLPPHPPPEDINRRPATAVGHNDPAPTHSHRKPPHRRARKVQDTPPPAPPNRSHRCQDYCSS